MNTAEEVNDECARSGSSCVFILGEEPVSEQHACAGTRVCLNHVEDGVAESLDLLCAERCEDAVVDRVVEEQHFCRFNKDRDQREKSVVNEHLYAAAENGENACHERTHEIEAQDRKEQTDNTEREVAHQHFESGLDLAVDCLVEFLHDPAGKRTHDHRTH